MCNLKKSIGNTVQYITFTAFPIYLQLITVRTTTFITTNVIGTSVKKLTSIQACVSMRTLINIYRT